MSKKLEQTNKAKEEFESPLLDVLSSDNKLSYQELIEMLNLSKRAVRNKLSDLSMYYPVISTSKEKGHRLAKNISNLNTIKELDLELREVNQTANEILSRIKILKGKLKPLIAWTKVAEKKMGELMNDE